MTDPLNIPIPQYPPFKLRSSLIENDPVIWAHILETYLKLFRFLVADASHPRALSVRSQQQLLLFIKGFLNETAQEKTRVLAIGAVNPDIRTNTAALRAYVFHYIKLMSLVKVGLSGEAVWDFIAVYVAGNTATVRSLVDGSFNSRYNDKKSGGISSIGPLQKHLQKLITLQNLTSEHLTTLSLLIGQYMGGATKTFTITGQAKVKNKPKAAPGTNFAQSFVSEQWIELLEASYSTGKNKQAAEAMVVSAISLSDAKMASVATALGISGAKQLKMAPLLSTVLISDAYKELCPGLEERLPFLHKSGNKDAPEEEAFDEDHIRTLIELFPQLTRGQAISVLKENNGDVEHVTNMLLEDPSLVESIEEYEEVSRKEKERLEKLTSATLKKSKNRFSDVDPSTIIRGKRLNGQEATAADVKNLTLTAALKLIYESEGDEPDDTYDDQEKTDGGPSKLRRSLIDADDLRPPLDRVSPIDRHLFLLFKTSGAKVFAKTARKTGVRGYARKATNWSDEQIEGWLTILLKSHRRFKILEDDFFFGGYTNRPNRPVPEEPKNEGGPEGLPQPRERLPKAKKLQKQREQSKKELSPAALKKTYAKNEKNKASRANHNRKSGHNKKAGHELAGMQ